MMKRLSVLLAGALAALGVASHAQAAATVDLVWTSSNSTDPAVSVGTSSILAAPGDSLTLSVMLTAGTEGISSWGYSVSYTLAELLVDPSLGDQTTPVTGADEFGLSPTVTCTPFPACFFGTPAMANFTPGVSAINEDGPTTGFVFTFEAGTLNNGVSNTFGAFKIGDIFFTVQTPVDNGADTFSGFFNAGADGAFDNNGQPVAMTFFDARVDPLDVTGPEPGTAALLGLGLLGLSLAGRRRHE